MNKDNETRIAVNARHNYEVMVTDGFEQLLTELLRLYRRERPMLIITDENVLPLYGRGLAANLKNGFDGVFTHALPAGEGSKSIGALCGVYDMLLKNGAGRDAVLIALGGGVVGDLTGLAAATYMRGVSFIQIPTTLLAQIDSSVGGKTAVDFGGYKNIVGAFYQPDFVYINVETLETLPRRELSAGMAEAVKYGLIMDAGFYGYLRENVGNIQRSDVLRHIVSSCVRLKAEIVEADERDTGIREILNFGHTFGHAVEALKEFDYLHGECVALGSLAAMELSRVRGGITQAHISEYKLLLKELGLPSSAAGLDPGNVYGAMLKDKKACSGGIRFVLLEEIGRAIGVSGITEREALEAVKIMLGESKG